MSTPRVCLALAFAVSLSATSSHAAWQPDGTQLSPSPGPLESYAIHGLISDGSGGAYAVWQYQKSLPDFSGSSLRLSVQRVDALGNIPSPWPATGTLVKSWVDNGSTGTLSMDVRDLLSHPSRGAILTVIDRAMSAEQVNYFRPYRILPSAAVSTYPPYFTDPFGGPASVDAAADADGAGGMFFIVLGQTFAQPVNPPPPSPLYVQHMDAAGNLLWPHLTGWGPELVPPGQAMFVRHPGLAALSDGAGGAFFVWADRRADTNGDLYLQRVDDSGNVAAGWPAGGVKICDAPGFQGDPRLVSDGGGGVIVVWRDERLDEIDPYPRLFATAVLEDGTVAPGIPANGRKLTSLSTDDEVVNVAGDGIGGCLVVRGATTPFLTGESRLHRLDTTMQPVSGWPAEGILLNTQSPGDGHVGLATDGFGGAYVSYRNGFGSTPPQGLYAQHFAGDGSIAPGWTSDAYRLSGTGQESFLVRSGDGAIVAWTDSRAPQQGVYAQRIVRDGPVAVKVSLASATARPDGVTITWFAAGGIGRATVERSDRSGAWSASGEVTADATGYLRYEDRAVAPGARYGYRLTWLEAGTARSSVGTWITVPSDLALSLESPRPNPASGAVSLGLTLPSSSGARLEVLDLAGRRLIARDLSLGAGRHLVRLEEAAALAPGVYTVRLAQGADSRLSRLCVVR